MITISIILVLVVLALAFYVFFKLLRGVVKAVIAVLFLVLFVAAIFGAVIYIDVVKLKGSFSADQTLLLSDRGSIVAGFVYANNPDSKILETTDIVMLSAQELDDISRKLNGGDYEKESGKGLTLVIDDSYFQDKSVELVANKSIMLNMQTINAIFTCDKLTSCEKILTDAAPDLKKQIAASFEDAQDVKNKLFFNLFIQETSKTKGAFLITGIREDKITVYPELTTLKLIKVIPDSIINRIVKKSIEDNTALSAAALNESE
jgi:hypothetical protein